jgi:hypothetical protein
MAKQRSIEVTSKLFFTGGFERHECRAFVSVLISKACLATALTVVAKCCDVRSFAKEPRSFLKTVDIPCTCKVQKRFNVLPFPFLLQLIRNITIIDGKAKKY